MSTSIPPRRRTSKAVEPDTAKPKARPNSTRSADEPRAAGPPLPAFSLDDAKLAAFLGSAAATGHKVGRQDRTANANSNGPVSQSAAATGRTAGQAERTQTEHGTQRTQTEHGTQRTQSTQPPGGMGSQRPQAVFTSVSSPASVSSAASVSSGLSASAVKRLRALVRSWAVTSPDPRGLRRDVFNLARRLRGVPEFAGATADQLEPWVRWWVRHSDLGGKSFSEAWAAFVQGFDKVKWAAGDGPLARHLKEARAVPPPEALDYPEGQLRDTAALCWVLQRKERNAGNQTFHLTTRDLADVLGYKSHNTAWLLLRRLMRDGIIVLREPGRRGHAPEYSFRSGDGE